MPGPRYPEGILRAAIRRDVGGKRDIPEGKSQNTDLPNGSRVKPIGGQESSAQILISQHIPDFLELHWRNTVIAASANTVQLQKEWCVSDLRRQLPKNIEAGGQLAPEAVSIETGTRDAVITASGVFTWHSHTEEPCVFSSQDWCSFILSSSLWSLLITPKHCRAYAKVDEGKLAECRRFILGYSSGTPSVQLMTRRLKKFCHKEAPCITPDMPEERLGEFFGKAVGICIGNKYRS